MPAVTKSVTYIFVVTQSRGSKHRNGLFELQSFLWLQLNQFTHSLIGKVSATLLL